MRSIELESVSKYFRDFCAVDDVSFGVDREEIVGFVGPNGAGKSTCLKMLATYLPPTRGKVAVARRRDPSAGRVRRSGQGGRVRWRRCAPPGRVAALPLRPPR